MTKIAFIFGMLLLPTIAISDVSYLCVADRATGFGYEKSTGWSNVSFTASSKYLVSKSTRKDTTWEVKTVGQRVPFSLCENDFSENGALICKGLPEIRMNRISGRFLSVYPIGYWSDDMNVKGETRFREGANTPFMEIGKCSPL